MNYFFRLSETTLPSISKSMSSKPHPLNSTGRSGRSLTALINSGAFILPMIALPTTTPSYPAFKCFLTSSNVSMPPVANEMIGPPLPGNNP